MTPIRWPGAVRQLTVYENNARFYLVGSDVSGARHAVLKIDRTSAAAPDELCAADGGGVYNKHEIGDILNMLVKGSQPYPKSSDKKASGLTERCSKAFGLLGFVRFLEEIGYHHIYKIEETQMLYIPFESTTHNSDESRYLRIFQSVDLSTNFYFSYTYDLTRTLQENATVNCSGAFYRQFLWNDYLIEPALRAGVLTSWFLPVVHGFVGQGIVQVPAAKFRLILIGRRSNKYSGTRFLKRGANLNGDVANDVETEQILWEASFSPSFNKGKFTAFVQRRGSVPVQWSQDPANRPPVLLTRKPPPIQIDQIDPFAQPAALHFREMRSKYGSPITIVDLVKQKEKRVHESVLHGHFLHSVEYLNQFLPPEEAICYLSFDLARCHKTQTDNALPKLEEIGYSVLSKNGWFQSFPELHCHKIRPSDLISSLSRRRTSGKFVLQSGAPRTNCVDCLDRTNVAQFSIGKVALAYQLYSMGFLSQPVLSLSTELCGLLEMLYGDLGDTLALQYAGSQLVHSIETYKKTAVFRERSRDVLQTLSRYYSNTFGDYDKQSAINLFLGVYRPYKTHLRMPLWDAQALGNDFLHQILRRPVNDFCDWYGCEDLEPSDDDERKKSEKRDYDEGKPVFPASDEFDNFYRTWELSSFDAMRTASAAHKVLSLEAVHRESTQRRQQQLMLWGGKKNAAPEKETQGAAAALLALASRAAAKPQSHSGSVDDDDSSESDDNASTPSTASGDKAAAATAAALHTHWPVAVQYDLWYETEGDSKSDRPVAKPEQLRIGAALHSREHCVTLGDGFRPNLSTGLLSMRQAYGYEVRPPSKSDMVKYENYMLLGGARGDLEVEAALIEMRQTRRLRMDLLKEIDYAHLKPMSFFTNDSALGTAMPVVSEQAMRIYERSVAVARDGPWRPDPKIYEKYLSAANSVRGRHMEGKVADGNGAESSDMTSWNSAVTSHWPPKQKVQWHTPAKFVEIAPGLYIGDGDAADDALTSQTRVVTHVLSVRNRHPLDISVSEAHLCTTENGTESLWIPADDDFDEDLIGSGKMWRAVSWLRQAVFGGNCSALVHCAFGISRSGAALAGILLVDLIDWRLVSKFLHMNKAACLPNENFLGQLMWLSNRMKQIYGSDSSRPTPRGHYRCIKCKNRLFTDSDLSVHWRRADNHDEMCTKMWLAAQFDGASKSSPNLSNDSFDGHSSEASAAHHQHSTSMDFEQRLSEEHRRMAVFELAANPENIVHNQNPCAAPDGSKPCAPKYVLRDAPQWLEATGEIADKIVCPFKHRGGAVCAAKLGKFDWAGRECKLDGCRTRIDPWFHISPDKVDRIPT